MDEKTKDRVSRLCTRIGASMEDQSADLLFTGAMNEVEIVALLNRVESALSEMQGLVGRVRTLIR